MDVPVRICRGVGIRVVVVLCLMVLGASRPGLAADCGLHRVVPTDPHALVSSGGLPRNALVRRAPGRSCVDGVAIEVLSVDPVYWGNDPLEDACVDADVLASVEGLLWVVPSPWNDDDRRRHPHPPGLIFESLPASVSCGAAELPFGARFVAVDELGPLRPIDRATYEAVLAVHVQANLRLGTVALTDILWTDGGRVSLPWVHWVSEAELRETHALERLDTEERQQKAVRGVGPAETYLYFKGSDELRSDIWGAPATIPALIETLADWRSVCGRLRPDHPAVCAVQLGDISWYSDKRPDPLGHRDHFGGTCVDVRLFRSDGSRYEAHWNRPDDRPAFAAAAGYDAELTGAFIDHLLARSDVHRVLFNDPQVASATAARGHDDHLHVCFDPSGR